MPTKEQEQWLWEQCGFKLEDGGWWCLPNGIGLLVSLPPIDLNNLFKYAVPKLVEIFGAANTLDLLISWLRDFLLWGKDPADSLFLLVYKALGGEDVRTQV